MATTTRRRWTEHTIEQELRTQLDTLGYFPTRAELVRQGMRGLWDAMRAHGGVDSWKQRLTAMPATPPSADLAHEQIAARAYQLYAAGTPGDDVAHWLAAESELRRAA